jgi:hypothetical protein
VAIITYGGTLLLTSGELVWLNSWDTKENQLVGQLMHSMSLAAAGAQVLVGLAALVLGILGLVGITLQDRCTKHSFHDRRVINVRTRCRTPLTK